uniref:PRA1 family protein n=1 Tax=Arcella intermedia TaxID=1963864 RepID=A0A6B2LJI8_9EUKA
MDHEPTYPQEDTRRGGNAFGLDGLASSAVGNNFIFDSVKNTLLNWKNERSKTVRAFGEFFDKTRISIPNVKDIPDRLKSNLVYFQSNYFILFLVLSVYSALTEPLFLLGVVFVAVIWIYNLRVRNTPIVVRQTEVPEKVVSFGLMLVSLLVLYFTSPNLGSVVQWLFVATTSLVFLHAFLYTPLPVDEFGFEGNPTANPNF